MNPRRAGDRKRRAPQETPNAVGRSVSPRITVAASLPPVVPELIGARALQYTTSVPVHIPAIDLPPFAPYSHHTNLASAPPSSTSLLHPYSATWANIFSDSHEMDHFPPARTYMEPAYVTLRMRQDSLASAYRAHLDNMGSSQLQELLDLLALADPEAGLCPCTISKFLKLGTYLGEDVGPSSEAESCCICQDDFMDAEELGMLECGHNYHSGCIIRWLVEKNVCPICKRIALPEVHQA